MDTKTKILIIVGSIAGLAIVGAVVYEVTKPTPLPQSTIVTTSSQGTATTSQGGILSAIVSGVVKAI